MGSEDGNAHERPVHEVCVDDFSMGKYEVTQGEWEAVMGNNPSLYKKGKKFPVEQISWEDAQKFIQKLNGLLSLLHPNLWSTYRLPTEAEWEYAARAGTTTEYSFGDNGMFGESIEDYAWYDKNSGNQPHQVGSLKPNPWGLYDMHGNMCEWVFDWFDMNYYSNSPRQNPEGPNSGFAKVLRGGGWIEDSSDVRSAVRFNKQPGRCFGGFGFRLSRVP